MIPTPLRRTITGSRRVSIEPRKVSETPRRLKITVNPATNRIDARSVTLLASRRPSSEVGSAEM